MSEHISIDRWGKDHWSTLAYIETRIVDHRGVPNREQMRCDPDIHPQFSNSGNASFPDSRYPTRLNDGSEIAGHDDWSCLKDAEREGLLEWHGTGIHPLFTLTDLGRKVAAELREHKANGGQFRTFQPSMAGAA